MNTIGFVYCGAATATLILAGTQQVFTAALSHFWLNQKLTRPQAASVSPSLCQATLLLFSLDHLQRNVLCRGVVFKVMIIARHAKLFIC